MNIVYYSSDFFAEICGVSMESLCENNLSSKEINIYIIEDNISENNKNKLLSIADRYSRNLIFISMPTQQEVYPDIKINLGRTYARMILGELLPASVDRVISLDSDTLIMDSIEEMYQINLEKNCIAGVYDCVGSAIQEKVLHAKDSLNYCNAGMFLIDLKAWRTERVGEKLLNSLMEIKERKKYMYFLEQDLINLVFEGKMKLLEPRYNLLTSIYVFNYNELIKLKKPKSYYSFEEIRDAKSKPAILHATTCFYVKKRMWVENSDHPYALFYKEFRSRTPWKNDVQIKDGRKKVRVIYAQFWHCIPRTMAIRLASFIINYIRPIYAIISSKVSLPTVAVQSAT